MHNCSQRCFTTHSLVNTSNIHSCITHSTI